MEFDPFSAMPVPSVKMFLDGQELAPGAVARFAQGTTHTLRVDLGGTPPARCLLTYRGRDSAAALQMTFTPELEEEVVVVDGRAEWQIRCGDSLVLPGEAGFHLGLASQQFVTPFWTESVLRKA
ncbi:hypothetical protein [Streptomyces sp. NPDC051567]|uniref:hypothetical protein n=1 Tax=Streptomyces sp. NPDC051567 TaxID=3365660 RepID=UPI0037A689D4